MSVNKTESLKSESPGSKRHVTPPPDYTETDPMGSKQSKQLQETTTSPGSTLQSSESSKFLRGMIPFSMAGDEAQNPPDSHVAYSIDNDPLLQENKGSGSTVFVGFIQKVILKGLKKFKKQISQVFLGLILTGLAVYLGFATAYSPYGAIAPLVFTGLGVLIATYTTIRNAYGKQIYHGVMLPIGNWWDRNWHVLKWLVYPAPLLGLVCYLSIMMTQVRQLQSLSGFVFFFLVTWLTSKHPDKVVWRPVIWGYSLQFLMALLVLQWEYGFIAVEWLADYVSKIIQFGFQGAAVAFGDPFMILHPFVMMGLSLLIFVGAVLSIFYYLGITQLVASKLAWAMSITMGTTAIETLGVAANILLNGMDVLLMLRPYLMKLTISEFNCFMVGNNATIAGFMFGVLILYGAPPQHLLTAAVMSAPATIAIAKLNWPETAPEKSVTKSMNDVRLSRGSERNLFEAAANGSAIAGKTVMTVVVNYISFMSVLNFTDATLSWLGGRVGYPEFSFGLICSYVFFPIALLIGIDVNQCRQVARVIGLKVFTTEIYAYQVLGDIYEQGLIDDRSKALGTYALCGFCSLSTLAIAIGIWQVICPQRRPLVSRLMIRVMMQANISCFTTACVAGLFYSEKLPVFDAEGRSPGQKLLTYLLGNIPQLFPSRTF